MDKRSIEYFKSIFATVVMNATKRDIISDLPPEISHMILRYLDPASLLRAARVSRKWLEICKSDKYLRKKAANYLNMLKHGIDILPMEYIEEMEEFSGWITRTYW